MKSKLNKLAALSAFILSLFLVAEVQAQQIVNISDEGNVNGVSCASSVIITDSGGETEDYGGSEHYIITLCIETVSLSSGQIIISPSGNGDTWDVDAGSQLFIYDGANTAATQYGPFNSVTDPNGVVFSGTSGCLTLEFISGPGSTGAGFEAHFTCIQPLQPFSFNITTDPGLDSFDDLTLPAIQICFGESIDVHTATTYPLSDASGNGYEQADSTTYFKYLMGDGTVYQGYGLTDISHTYSDEYGFEVTVILTDNHGQVETGQFYVLIAPRPDFSNLVVDDTLCIDDETDITGGVSNGDFIGVDPSTAAILGGGILGEQLYLPDGNNENYTTTITIDEFDEGQVIQNASDIINFCVTMEHTYLGDLEMMLTCPDGTSINVFNAYTGDGLFPGGFGGGGTFLGDANEENFQEATAPGIGFEYCFSADAEFGTMGDEYSAGNTVPVSTFDNGNAMAPGTYLPEEPISNFIGCPINGDWTLTVRDNLGIDDGYIFNWSIYFNPDINPSTVYYSPEIDSVYWEPNEDIIASNGATITVKPSEEGNNAFTFVAVDEFECVHDTTIFVYVRPHIEFDDAIACDLTHIASPTNSPNGGVYTTLNTPTPTANLEFVPIFEGLSADSIFANEYGVYEVAFVENNCLYSDTASIDFRPDPQIEAFLDSTVLCINESVVLDAGPQESNSDNFNIVWTQNGNSFNTSDYAVTVDETGTYILTITGVCGAAIDTTKIVAIELTFEGDTVCGLQASGEVSLSPAGTGVWSASTDISFSTANQLSTQISSSKYGSYPITFTDERCPEDGVTHDFTFVEQPVTTILPANPDFCVDSDSLILTANVNGSNQGIYTWSINGTTELGNGNSLTFGPDHFEPLQDYLIEVLVRDAFGVCPLSTGVANFTGHWCEYNIPNVITPNGDGMNDSFHVQYIGFFPGTKLRVFDRWGNLVFEQADYDQFQGTEYPETNSKGWVPADDIVAGTYFYELLIPSIDKKESGYIEVLKKDSEQ